MDEEKGFGLHVSWKMANLVAELSGLDDGLILDYNIRFETVCGSGEYDRCRLHLWMSCNSILNLAQPRTSYVRISYVKLSREERGNKFSFMMC